MIQPAAVLRSPTPSTRIAAPQIAAIGGFSLDAVTSGAMDGAAGATDLPAIDGAAPDRQPPAATGNVLPVESEPAFAWAPAMAPAPLASMEPPVVGEEQATPAPPPAPPVAPPAATTSPGAPAPVATVALNTSALTPLIATATPPTSAPIAPAARRAGPTPGSPRQVMPEAEPVEDTPTVDEQPDATERDADTPAPAPEPTPVVAMPLVMVPGTPPIAIILAPPAAPVTTPREMPASTVDTLLPAVPVVATSPVGKPDLSPASAPAQTSSSTPTSNGAPIPMLPAANAAAPSIAAPAPLPAAPPVAAGAAGLQVAAAIMGAMPAMTRLDPDSAPSIQPLATTPVPTVAAAAQPVVATATPAPVDTPSRWTPLTAAIPLAITPSQPQPAPQPGIVAPAAQIFGAAIAAARRQDDPARRTDAPIDAAIAAGAATPSVAPATAAQQAPLDMRQDRWPHAMIDRIASLRDAANETDTRIRLIPDALGTIDVSVRTDGDTVHVRFAAEQAATRAMLQDAQPRLADLAESRGLKLAQSNVDAGTGQQHRGAAPHQAQPPKAPPRGPRAADTDSTDTRLA